MCSSYYNETNLGESAELSFNQVIMFGYVLLVVFFSLVPLIVLIIGAIWFCLDEREWEREIAHYNEMEMMNAFAEGMERMIKSFPCIVPERTPGSISSV